MRESLVQLSFPDASCRFYAIYNGWALGPFDSSGNQPCSLVDFSIEDDIQTDAAVYGENRCDHRQIKSITPLAYQPHLALVTSAPSLDAPNRIKLPVGSGTAYVYLDYGIAAPGVCSRLHGGTVWYHRAILNISSYQWCEYTIVTYNSPKTDVLSVNFTEYTNETFTTQEARYARRSYYYGVSSNNARTALDWTAKRSFADVLQTFLDLSGKGGDPTIHDSTVIAPVYSFRGNPSAIVSACQDEIISYARCPSSWQQIELPEEAHYGELAHEATAQVNATDTNVLAFLRDLRHPTSMIPKFKNLMKIKHLRKAFHFRDLSDDYLSIQYGLLPTVSDIRNVLRAFKEKARSKDRWGFALYNASRVHQCAAGLSTRKRTQRIKIAVSDVDSDVSRLALQVEKWGLYPSAKNLWDLLPYTFIIDWLADVGKFLERCDTIHRLARFKILYVTMSRKDETTLSLPISPSFPYSGDLTRVVYQRWTDDQCPLPPLTLESPLNGFNHWIEAGALILQRTKL